MAYRDRSVAIVVRNGKILMERLCYPDANNGKEFFSIPGGGIEEAGAEKPSLREVVWKKLNEINEKELAFLWSYGLVHVQNFYETIVGWGDEISYPGQN